MSLYELVIAEYPELETTDSFLNGTISLRDDSDGTGAYIAAWNYSKPIPASLSKYDRTNG
jgi:hypothetical protein